MLVFACLPCGGARAATPTTVGVMQSFTLEPGKDHVELAECPAGTDVISGGFTQHGADGIVLTAGPLVASPKSGYEVEIMNPNQPPDFRAASIDTVHVYATCAVVGRPVVFGSADASGLKPGTARGTLHEVKTTVTIGKDVGGNSNNDLAKCPAGTEIVGGGFHQSSYLGVPLVLSPTTKRDGFEALIYNPPSNTQWPDPMKAPFSRISVPDDVQIVALCGEIGRPLVPGKTIIESKTKVKQPRHPLTGNVTRQGKTVKLPIAKSPGDSVGCTGDPYTGGIEQGSDHGVIFAAYSQPGSWFGSARNPQPNPLWAEPPMDSTMFVLALCVPYGKPLIPGPVKG
jgi:hypothetical protein